MLYVDSWIREHPDARPCAVIAGEYGIDEQFYDLPDVEVPRLLLKNNRKPSDTANGEPVELPQDGYYIVSVKHLYDLPGYAGTGYFRFLEPVDRITYSYLVYRIGDEERERIRGLITGKE